MDEKTLIATLTTYCEAFDARDPARRLALLERSMTPTAEIWGPGQVFHGYAAISGKIARFHVNWPECRLGITTGFNTFLNATHFGIALLAADGSVRATGRNITEFADDGRIQRVLPLWEALPPIPAAWPARFAPAA